jgi:hypothetical protein
MISGQWSVISGRCSILRQRRRCAAVLLAASVLLLLVAGCR